MDTKNFSSEFYEIVDFIITQYIDKNNLDFPMHTFLFQRSHNLKEDYNNWRTSGISLEKCTIRLESELFPSGTKHSRLNESSQNHTDITKHEWYQSLKNLSGQLVFYIYNNEQLYFLLPLIKKMNRPIILLLEPGINDDLTVENNIKAIEIDFSSNLKLYNNQFVEANFPEVSKYYNTFSFLMEVLSPEGIVFVESDYFQQQILSVVTQKKNIACLTIQQKCPSTLCLSHQKKYYQYLLTWGESFNEEWSKREPNTKFISTGYIQPVEINEMRNSILFFLKSPLLISNETYLNALIEIIYKTAQKYPETQVLIFEPAVGILNKAIVEKMKQYGNIYFVSDMPLSKVLAHTQIMISFYCSALLESMAYKCIPLVFDPISRTDILLDIETLKIGKIAANEEDFFLKLDEIRNFSSVFLEKIACEKEKWFCAVGDDALQRTTDCINKIACCHYLKENKEPRIHIGCGLYPIEGWLNVDIEDYPKTYYLNAGKPYPFPDNSFNYIFSEHLFEHLTLEQGIAMLKECYRILKPGGKKRMAMPDLNFLIDLYSHPEKEINQRYLRWCTPLFVPEIKEFYQEDEYPPIFAFNNFFHAWGHQFIHSFEEVKTLASNVGFKNIKQCSIGESNTLAFQSIEKHNNRIPSWANKLETVVLEMEK